MKILAQLITPVLLLLTSCQAQEQARTNVYEQYFTKLSERGQFNGVVLVYDTGKVVYEGAFGIRSIDPLDSLDLNSQFRLGSVSKQFTALSIMQLMEQGKLKYDQDIRAIIPELPYEGITIRHLLHHVSGLPDYEPLMDQYWKPELAADDPARYTSGNTDIIALLAAKKPPVYFRPGEKWRYSNTGYNLLGTIVARASGMSFAAYMKKYIFDPTGMSNSVLYDFVIGTDPQMPDRAYGFQLGWNGTDRSAADSHFLNRGLGEDGVYSTVGDLLKWDRILYTDKLVRTATLAEAFTPAVLNDGRTTDYGFGWFIARSPAGKRLVMHSGGWLAFSTHIFRAIEEDKCIVVLTNSAQSDLSEVVEGITDLLYGRPAAWPTLSIRQAMGREVAEKGVLEAIAQYKQWKAERAAEFRFSEADLNLLGYELLWADRIDDAVAILRLTKEEYPGSANAYDSYGDALLAQGDSLGAVENFKKAFALDPEFAAAQKKAVAIEAGLSKGK